MKNLVYINGRLIPETKAQISVLDSAYLYGEGIFETLSAEAGRVCFLERHLNRLYRSARRLNISIPLSRAKMRAAIHRTLYANKIQNAVIRIEISHREASVGRRERKALGTHLVIFAKPFLPYPEPLYRNGCRVILIRSVRNDSLPLSGIKSTNYLTKMIARREIASQKAAEGILMNPAGRLTEGASSSFFIVKKGVLLTPPLRDGLLPSITREVIIELAKKLKIPVREKSLQLAEVKKATEMFMASTIKRILPVGNFDGGKFRAPGAITSRLVEAFIAVRHAAI